jgi:hypothetical protein
MKTGRRNSNSTEPSAHEGRIMALYEKFVMGDESLRRDALASMGTGVYAGADSYFESPSHPDAISHVAMDLDSETDLTRALESLWRGDAARLAMIPETVRIAGELKNSSQEQSAEIDSFIYVMY